jgi:hypothetical protein
MASIESPEPELSLSASEESAPTPRSTSKAPRGKSPRWPDEHRAFLLLCRQQGLTYKECIIRLRDEFGVNRTNIACRLAVYQTGRKGNAGRHDSILGPGQHQQHRIDRNSRYPRSGTRTLIPATRQSDAGHSTALYAMHPNGYPQGGYSAPPSAMQPRTADDSDVAQTLVILSQGAGRQANQQASYDTQAHQPGQYASIAQPPVAESQRYYGLGAAGQAYSPMAQSSYQPGPSSYSAPQATMYHPSRTVGQPPHLEPQTAYQHAPRNDFHRDSMHLPIPVPDPRAQAYLTPPTTRENSTTLPPIRDLIMDVDRRLEATRTSEHHRQHHRTSDAYEARENDEGAHERRRCVPQ